MLCRIFRFFAIVVAIFTPMLVRADDIPMIAITDKTNPKIAELYQKLQDKSAEIAGIESERRGALEENATAMYEKEQSLENKTLTATTTAATGLGAMEAASAYAKQLADADAAEEMSAYITTMKCEYGNGKQVNLGNEETLPGGGELSGYYTEYKQLAERLKATKAALNLRPGIESQILYDRAESGIYQYQTAEQQSGAYTSLSRALMNPDGDDATAWNTQKQENSENLKAGLIAAGGGIVAGVIGNYEINKDAPKESSTEINREYDDKVSKVNKEKTDIETELTAAIEENAKLVADYNGKITQLKKGLPAIKTMPEGCQVLVEGYVAAVENLELIENETDFVPDTVMPEVDSDLLTQCAQCKNKGADFNSVTKECKCPADKPVEEGGKCVEKPTEIVPGGEEQPHVQITEQPADIKEIQPDESETEQKDEPEVDPNQCPATGNRLKSITDQNRIGDFCSSTNIATGEIVWWSGSKKGNKICTCRAYSCNPGFHSEKGSCQKDVVEEPECPRQDYTNVSEKELENGPLAFCERKKTGKCKITSVSVIKGNVICNLENFENGFCPAEPYDMGEENNTIQKCQDFCKTKAIEKSCLYKGAMIQPSKEDCICNPDSLDFAESNMYKEVCGKDKGKTGKKEYCVKDFFNWTQTQVRQALAFAKDYARIKNNHDILCIEKYRTSGNDDYIKCATKDESVYYEFKFDDVTESIDATRRASERLALCKLMGGEFAPVTNAYSAASAVKGNSKCANISQNKCGELKKMAKRYGHSVEYDSKKNACLFIEEGDKNVKTSEEFENSLAKIEGLDNYHFFDEIQVRGSANLVRSLRTYAQSKIPEMKTFKCDDGYKTVKKADGILSRIIGNTDDILRCYVDREPIDFVFDDLSEAWRTTREAGESGIACKTKGGAYARDKCHGLSPEKCTEIGEDLKRRNPKSSGTQFVNDECELIDGQEQKILEDAIQVSMGAIALVDCAVGTHLGCVLAVVEGVSLATEMGTGEEMQERANEFLKEATMCHDRGCAITTLKTLGGRVLTIKDALSSTSTAKSVDEHLARLIGYLEPEDLKGEVSEDDWNEIVRQLGGDPEDKSGKALKIANKIGFIGQFASVGTSTLRLTGQAVAKLAAKSAAKGGKTAQKLVGAGTKVSKALDTTGDAAKAGKGGAKTGDAADDASKAGKGGAPKNPKDGGGADAGNNSGKGGAGAGTQGATSGKRGSNSIHSDITNYRNATNKKSAKHALLIKYHPDKVAGYRSEELTGLAEEITRRIDKIDNLSEAEFRELSQMMDEFDRSVETAESAKRAAASAEEASRASQKAENSSQGTKKSTTTDSKTSQSGTKSKETGAKNNGSSSGNSGKTSNADAGNNSGKGGTKSGAQGASGGSTNKNTSGTKSTAGVKGATSGATNSIDALKTRASSNFDNYLQSCLAGQECVGLPINRLTKEEWQQLNQYAKSRGAELYETKMFNKKTGTYDDVMQFRRIDNSANATGYARAAGKANDVELNENELVRVVGNEGREINSIYVKNAKEARQYLNDAVNSGKYTRSVDDYMETMNEMHRISAMGVDGKSDYYAAIGKDSRKVNPGQIRSARWEYSNDYKDKALKFEQIAKQYGDPYRTNTLSQIELPGIPKNNLPYNKGTSHVYPNGGEALRPYYEQMRRTAQEALNLIDSGASERAILEKIAEHYNYAIAARPYGQINNSLFMNEVNTLLRKAGLKTMPQGELDFAAMYLQPNTFKKYFIDTYYKTRL